ncbi:ketopantoate hydroxymethyltransferase [Paenibacillus vini]|uniref:ketopantoate hydroxymethyltransferase n=1 Tax=Paenibacillus vini TaxID=1476024 RepID=UPI0025B64D61|nr:ketopantoate hydroxymethyltransferase [Paenibacillus vini]MDN4069276.1 ketopantoate hydroxymethyltransferase [Paenibacillus vini]MDN4069329.1 ketopantoate hydroxymethyltransferase [Paenibacillus vini]
MIASSFLNGVANYTHGRIAKVVLNDSIEIANFTIKEVTESTVGMQYIVPAALVSLVTKIDLKDSNNNLISTNNVYVPIASDTLLLQTILIKEV